ncbi:MAG: glycosyltransferase family 8 protein [Ruminococcus sp.]|nr:glycosyltransferase family 8 protein [Ruminococcus sp.]
MNIVYASDDNFAEIMGVSLLSLFENNRECPEINVFILDGGIGGENREKLLSLGETFGRDIDFTDVTSVLKGEMRQQRGSLSTFSRLYMGDILPAHIQKLLYLDCDTIVMGSLGELYDTDISEHYGAGAGDCVSGEHRKILGLSPDSVYVNVGVLLVNLKKWRENNLSDKFVTFANDYNNKVPCADQGILNGVLSAKLKEIPLKYNSYTALYDFSYGDLCLFRKPSRFYTEEEVSEAKENPSVIHFTTSFLSLRPWIRGSGHPYASLWLEYKSRSSWADVPLREDSRPPLKKLMTGVYKLLPKKLAASAAGVIHAKIKPRAESGKRS